MHRQPAQTSQTKTATAVLIGNPNTGKSTLFNALAGMNQRVGNYPGVTVEKKTGRAICGGQPFLLIDLPGTYSLAPRSPDEMVTIDVLLGRRPEVPPPDVVLCVVDASNLERNLYLVTQVLELGLPVVVALNMTDLAARKGIRIDVPRLQQRLGVPVVPLQAHRGIGVPELRQALAQAVSLSPPAPLVRFPEVLQQQCRALEQRVRWRNGQAIPELLARRLLLDGNEYLLESGLFQSTEPLRDLVERGRQALGTLGVPGPVLEATCRYQKIQQLLDGVVHQETQHRKKDWTDRIDRVLTHKVAGTLIFLLAMATVFQAVFSWATPLMDLLDDAVGRLGELVATWLPPGPFTDLLVDGVIAGVGAVVVFLPQILILFGFLAMLEDCGYMARAAYLMDRLMVPIGLSGKSFIPLLSSFACAVPGIMATRVIDDRRDRLATILVAPLMSCSARLPVYVLFISAFIPDRSWLGGWIRLQSLTMIAMYGVGMVVAAGVAWTLKRTLLRGTPPPFVLELPPYKIPSVRTVVLRMVERGWAFLRRAGTLILAVSILVWAASYFPHSPRVARQVEQQYASQLQALKARLATQPAGSPSWEETRRQMETLQQQMERDIQARYMAESFLGRAGHWIEPVVRPLGWDWKIGCAVIASFPAREVVIGALGVLYNAGQTDEADATLRARLQQARWPDTGAPVFTIPVALSIMVFFALCAQCAATLVVIRRETNSRLWPLFTFLYMTTLAYLGALLTYQIGSRLF